MLRNPSGLVIAMVLLSGHMASPWSSAPAQSSANAPVGKNGKPLTCGSCHPGQANVEPTPMARAMEVPGANRVLAAHPSLKTERGGFTYRVETHGNESTYSVSDGARTISVPLRWGMGSGEQTWVFKRDGKFYESMMSYYPAINGLDVTIGDEKIKITSLEQAFARELSSADVKSCFGCHSSSAVSSLAFNVESRKPGVTCEHCHVGAMEHMADAAHKKLDTAPPDLSKLSSEGLSNFCGQCHRSWELVVRSQWRGESNVRFQPYRLAMSKCFDGTDARISCLACHDPHHDLIRETTVYDAKCLACHASGLTTAAVKTPEGVKSCPVAKSKCTSCHMPKVVVPGGGNHIALTDHRIRIVKPGEPYPD